MTMIPRPVCSDATPASRASVRVKVDVTVRLRSETVVRHINEPYVPHFRTARLDQHLPPLPERDAARRDTVWAEPTATIGDGPTRRPHRLISKEPIMSDKPSVLFVCVHNAGRSQMAAGWLRHLAGDTVEVRSAGSAPATQINPAAVEAMREVGIDITDQTPKLLEWETAESSDVIVTMGCGDACPVFPGKRYEDWQLDDPAGQGVEAVRPIRDDIRGRIEKLVAELAAGRAAG
jgi:arsenate reductase